MSEPITKRAIDWNKARYKQEFDYDLAVKLLLEETEELYKANSIIEKLDAIGDITFVAIGVLWKLGFSDQQIYDIFYSANMTKMTLEDAHHWMMNVQILSMDIIDHEVKAAWPGVVLTLYSVFNTCIGAIHGLGLQNIYYDVVHAICDSNDTKIITPNTPAHIKANINKGSNFIPPEAKLLELYKASLDAQKRLH